MTNSSDKIHQQLLQLATQAQKNAHAPYSNFKVGAAILDENNQQHASCNVENAAYPLGQCAEAGAISAMISSGNTQIKQILIVSPNDNFCPPCGGCRQKIAEFANDQTQVHLAKSNGEVKSVHFKDLLPLAFGFDKNEST
ncbi:cytidine deaminase [Paraglaciecola aquimarina]|uniref:Cytidine deaminase n=1 Tax=Paraglaciecola algarum TaxID=3050085 RepID=A0ABS9DCT4_9ALTE|nr:cytidine deaminase [Paraglaciecola sp. G1-23]MCF2949451.1 cytidine deaminase [Paraglaciecola sp. G1-23]